MSRHEKPREDRYEWERTRGVISAFGEAKTVNQWAADPRCTVKREALRNRLALGWAPAVAITRPKYEQPVLEFTHNGRTRTLRGWAEQSGINYHTLYRRITKGNMTFPDALAKGSDGPHFTIPVSAFGETKPLHQWGVDERANCTAQTIGRRIRRGWDPEQAITQEPDSRSTLGTGVPLDAFGRRMGIEDWARLSQIPTGVITQRMDSHGLTLETALRSLGWVPDETDAALPDLVRTPAGELRPGDTIVAVTQDPGTDDLCFTVRRIEIPELAADA
ncbi:hypothetical protein [Nocardia sp. XZ_19_369]|uniref:hypothetical protein n=1 Tax=Nocardia sp. XZ_19_369 TaxID=2769487 RepID=UPI00188DCECA|nr:hypothetical protein [Nocardia sp. XZ_19_369]